MRVAYIASPYRPTGIWKRIPIVRWIIIAWNIRRARNVALKYWRNGYAVICPNSNTAFFDGKCPDEVWLRGDLEMMRRCDLVVFGKGWEKSVGCCAEYIQATAWDKDVDEYVSDTHALRSRKIPLP